MPAGDPRHSRRRSQRVLTDRALAARLAAAGDARASEFSMDSLAEAYLGIYDDAIAGPRGALPLTSRDRGARPGSEAL